MRRENSPELVATLPAEIDCLEIAPENYLHVGGRRYREFRQLAERYPIIFHGLSLSVGSLKPVPWEFLGEVKAFLKKYNAEWFSDHLCYSSVMGAQFHDLLPLPFTREAVAHVVPRIRQIQDYLEMPFAIENISYYAHPGEAEMTEWEFVTEIVEKADCSLLLDVNNVYVNSVNHRFDPYEYFKHLPLERVLQIHIAGHRRMEDFLLDNHGSPIIDPVWNLLGHVCTKTEIPAIIIERDNNLPPLAEFIAETRTAKKIVQNAKEDPARFNPHPSAAPLFSQIKRKKA